eukprot:11376557-Karenia_brevis.AAC.1
MTETVNDMRTDTHECKVEWREYEHYIPHLTLPERKYQSGDCWANFPPVLRSSIDGKICAEPKIQKAIDDLLAETGEDQQTAYKKAFDEI